MADPRRPHPAPPGPASDQRSAPPLGETHTAGHAAHPSPRPPRVSPPPREDRHRGQRAETLPARPRPPQRTSNRSRTPLPSRQGKPQTTHIRPTKPSSLTFKNKLRRRGDRRPFGESGTSPRSTITDV